MNRLASLTPFAVLLALASAACRAPSAAPLVRAATLTPQYPMASATSSSYTSTLDCPGCEPGDPNPVCKDNSLTPTPSRISSPTYAPHTATAWPPYVRINAPLAPTLTPAPPQSCPEIRDDVPTPDAFSLQKEHFPPTLLPSHLEYLNQGGSSSRLPPDLPPSAAEVAPRLITDLTGDGVPELAFWYYDFYILGCKEGQYDTLLFLPMDAHGEAPRIVLLEDANGNGIPELVAQTATTTMMGRSFSVFEWSATGFRDILAPSSESPFRPHVFDWEEPREYFSSVVEPHFWDIDHDGQLELVFHNDIPVWSDYVDGLPWRIQDDVFEWDGETYVPYESRLTEPVYRFQAVLDGDQAALFGDYKAAFASYQAAINDPNLSWWSLDRYLYMGHRYQSRYDGGPTLEAPPTPDPNEYPNLAAYSRYRIMILLAVTGDLGRAEEVEESLRVKYPPADQGGQYTELAVRFMEELGKSKDIGRACVAVATTANTDEERYLQYLRGQPHGHQAPLYTAQDLCPWGQLVPAPKPPFSTP